MTARRRRPNRGKRLSERVRRERLEEWKSRWGNNCPGWAVKPHPASAGNPLTIDHEVPRRWGGSNDWDNLTVLCRRCNSRKRDGKRDRPLRSMAPHMYQGPEYRNPLNDYQ